MADKTTKTLDSRIATALSANGKVDRATLVELIREAGEAIEMANVVIDAETPRLHDLSNDTPDASQQLIASSRLRVERLTKAIAALDARIEQIDLAAQQTSWNEEYDRLQDETAALAEEFAEKYPTLRAELVGLFIRLDDNRAAVGNLYRQRGPHRTGDRPELIEAELLARGLEMFTVHQPRLQDSLKLPAFADPAKVFPRDEYAELMRATALQTSEAIRALEQRRAATGMYSGDWWAAKQLENEQLRAESERRDEEQRKQNEAAREAYYASLQAEELRRRGLDPQTGGPDSERNF